MGKKNKRVLFRDIIQGMLIICLVFGMMGCSSRNVTREELETNLKKINEECNKVYNDLEGSEKKYLDALKSEEDIFMKGLYSSALAQVYSSRYKYNEVIKYTEQACDYYLQLPGGAYYAIYEKKFLAWNLLGMGEYSESFKTTSSIIEMTEDLEEGILTKEELEDTNVLVNTIFLTMYSDLEILDLATVYYNKLTQSKISDSVLEDRGEKISFSKTLYTSKIENYKKMKGYATESYEILLEKDKVTGTNNANSVLINIILADIELGNYDNIEEGLKELEGYYKNRDDDYGLSGVKIAYAKYYEKTNYIDKSARYYQEGINICKNILVDSTLMGIIEDFISLIEENNLEEAYSLEEYYDLYYSISKNNSLDKNVNELVAQMVQTNETYYQGNLQDLQEEMREKQKGLLSLVLIVVLLGILVINMAVAIKKKNATEKKLEEIANRDYLTGIHTRSYGEKLISNLMIENKNFSLSVLDIDNFKNINDNYGHMYGDDVLRIIANKIKAHTKKEDIVIRFGGEEFIIVFLDCNVQEAKVKLDTLRNDISNIIFKENIKVTISGGIKEWNKSQSIEEVMIDADFLLYKSKSEGKNKISI